ncbi:hypothetical protein D3Z58_04215 [Clostridiaceae bacterium]|nr:hypothetical protein [Clostridiaceae bacterium]
MRKHPEVEMRAVELGELYTDLKLFGQVYTDCERERLILEHGIEEVFDREYSGAPQSMRNPRKAGRRRKNGPEAQKQIRVLSGQGKTIREISAETGIPKSTVHRLKKDI